MLKTKKQELTIFLIIVGIAAFFRLYQLDQFPPGLYPDEAMNGNNAIQSLETSQYNIFYPENNGREGLFIGLQAISLKIFGIHAWSLRIVSAIIGILTVIGLYLLTRELFEWRLAAISSFLMAISFWHVNFSRIGFRAIMLPFILVYVFYFLWKGIKKAHLTDFFLAGIFGGLGFYTYISYRVAPLVALVLFINYWWYLKKDFDHSKYEHAKTKLLQGFVIFAFTAFAVALPMGLHFWNHPDDFFSRSSSGLSVLSKDHPLKELGISVVKTLGMFNFSGDWNQRHNIPGSPMLPWPIGIFFVVGFINELIHWFKRKHGHFSTVHTLMFAWFFTMLLPGFLSTEAPHAIRTIGTLPVIIIFTARGIWWFFDKLRSWYSLRDPHSIHEAHAITALVMIIFLFSIGFVEYWRYFKVWSPAPETATAFNQNYIDIANKLNSTKSTVKRYILVNEDGVLVNGIPMPAQTVIFLTDTYTAEKQKAKNIFYLTESQYQKGQYSKNSIVIPLKK